MSNSRALRIIAAAAEEFSRYGFDGARIARIARRAGVNKQLLFYYFHSKRGLFSAVLGQGAAELERALSDLPVPGRDPLDRIRAALALQFDFLARHPDLVLLLTSAGRSDARPFAPAIKQLVVLLAEGQGRGDYVSLQGPRSLRGDFQDLFGLHPNNTFLVKASYWINW